MTRSAAALLFVVAASACAEPSSDELDADDVSDLATQVGTARGIAASGVYTVQLSDDGCGCADIDPALWGLTLCQQGLLEGGLPLQTNFDVVTADGVLSLASPVSPANPVGPLDADGAFEAGSVVRLTSLVSTAFQIVRVDGALEPTETDGFHLEGRIRNRLIGRVELDGIDDIEFDNVDCEETVRFEGERSFAR